MSEPDEDDDDFRSAADDPTAMWDDDALRKAGMADVAGRADARDAAPATSYGVRGDQRESVVVGRSSGGSAGPARRPAGGLSWPITIALALALGAVVYFLVRFLR